MQQEQSVALYTHTTNDAVIKRRGSASFIRPDPAVIFKLAGYASVWNSQLDQAPSPYFLFFTVCLHLLQFA